MATFNNSNLRMWQIIVHYAILSHDNFRVCFERL